MVVLNCSGNELTPKQLMEIQTKFKTDVISVCNLETIDSNLYSKLFSNYLDHIDNEEDKIEQEFIDKFIGTEYQLIVFPTTFFNTKTSFYLGAKVTKKKIQQHIAFPYLMPDLSETAHIKYIFRNISHK